MQILIHSKIGNNSSDKPTILSGVVYGDTWFLPGGQNWASTFFKDAGAAYGTAKAGIGIASMGVLKPELILKSIVPIVMAGILGIYGLIIAVILLQKSILSFVSPQL